MISREEALNLISSRISDERYFKHMVAVEAVMRGLARRMGEDEELWGLTGLLHDLDYEAVGGDFSRHGLEAAEMLKGRLPENCLNAIRAHNYEHTGVDPKDKLSYALIASDAISGLIVATALVMPHKRLEEVRVRSVLKKFKSKDFARGVDRSRILFCEKLGLTLEEFVETALEAMKSVADELGL